jgi:selenocysteine lyase/cysteine desulfurase
MNKGRRKFLSHSASLLGGLALLPTDVLSAEAIHAQALMRQIESNTNNDEDFWSWVRQSYTVSRSLINLNNGGVSPQPKVVQEAFVRFNELSNEGPSYYMWRILDKGRESLRAKLAQLAGVSPEEIAINRNTTEALDTVFNGLDFKKGDEIVMTAYDYPNMVNMLNQLKKRYGVVLKYVNLQLPEDNTQKIVDAFSAQFTNRTKLVLVTHMINWTGQLLPAKEICAAAHQKGIEVMVDGAHTFAHINFKISDLGCDYFGTSLHKWLCAPFGTGMLYVKRDKIAKLWANFPPENVEWDDIRKFESLGTRSFPTEQAIAQAIDFHLAIGAERKEKRLKDLKNYWVNALSTNKKVSFCIPKNQDYSGALASFSIEGLTSDKIADTLHSKFAIHAVAMKVQNIDCVRITPHVYTSFAELDNFISAVNKISATH